MIDLYDDVKTFTKRFSDAYDMAYKRNPERYTTFGDRIPTQIMYEHMKYLDTEKKKQKQKQKPKPVEKPVEAVSEKKKVSLRELLQRRKNRGLYDEVFDMIANSEDI